MTFSTSIYITYHAVYSGHIHTATDFNLCPPAQVYSTGPEVFPLKVRRHRQYDRPPRFLGRQALHRSEKEGDTDRPTAAGVLLQHGVCLFRKGRQHSVHPLLLMKYNLDPELRFRKENGICSRSRRACSPFCAPWSTNSRYIFSLNLVIFNVLTYGIRGACGRCL